MGANGTAVNGSSSSGSFTQQDAQAVYDLANSNTKLALQVRHALYVIEQTLDRYT